MNLIVIDLAPDTARLMGSIKKDLGTFIFCSLQVKE